MQKIPVMMFAAGFGTRMGELTKDRPKPLIKVAGKTLIDHALEVVDGAAAGPVVVNLHYRGDQIRSHLTARRDVLFSDEAERILETGGGLRKALPLLGERTVFTLNTDAVWSGENPLQRLLSAWQPDRMDALLLLLPANKAKGHAAKPDFALDDMGRISRGAGDETHVYVGAQILKTDRLAEIDGEVFSLNRLWNILMPEGRLAGVEYKGGWCDVGHPEGIRIAEAMLRQGPP
ncbi:MAG: nucleotidyltransferase family protein [Paracoccaceae bacterium]